MTIVYSKKIWLRKEYSSGIEKNSFIHLPHIDKQWTGIINDIEQYNGYGRE